MPVFARVHPELFRNAIFQRPVLLSDVTVYVPASPEMCTLSPGGTVLPARNAGGPSLEEVWSTIPSLNQRGSRTVEGPIVKRKAGIIFFLSSM